MLINERQLLPDNFVQLPDNSGRVGKIVELEEKGQWTEIASPIKRQGKHSAINSCELISGKYSIERNANDIAWYPRITGLITGGDHDLA